MWRIAVLGALGCFLFSAEAMAQCYSLPYTLTNGTTADAGQVMANFNCTAVTGGATLSSPTLAGSITVAGSFTGTGSVSLITDSSAPARYTNAANFFSAGNSATVATMEIMQGYYLQPALAISADNTVLVTAVEFLQAGSVVGTIQTGGGATAYNTSSDARLKIVSPKQINYRNAIKSLWVGNFTWKKSQQPGFGILAQQTYQFFPFAISKPDDPQKMWQADYGKLAPLAIWGVKDLYKIAAGQDNEIAQLKSTVKSLQAVNDNQATELKHLETQMSALERALRVRTAQR